VPPVPPAALVASFGLSRYGRRPAGRSRLADGSFGPMTAADREPLGSPYPPNGFRYLSLVTMPGGRQRVYYEATRADGAHDLRTEPA